jgi:hypothetical protein
MTLASHPDKENMHSHLTYSFELNYAILRYFTRAWRVLERSYHLSSLSLHTFLNLGTGFPSTLLYVLQYAALVSSVGWTVMTSESHE